MNKKHVKKVLPWAMITCLSACCLSAVPAYADEKTTGYVVFGEDLSADQQKDLSDNYFKLQENRCDEYKYSYCTNEEEHEAFDSYLSSSVIGTRAVSSICLEPADEGDGITIYTMNISYCTKEMYQNALISAGVSDVDVYVAAPFEVSGTCALLSAMNAYELMTGENLDEDAVDTAMDEIVTTGEVGEAIGDNDTAAELIASLKQEIAEQGDDLTDEQLNSLIDQTAEDMGLSLDDQIKEQILELLKKINSLDIDVDTLKQQAGDLYSKVSNLVENANIEIPEVDTEEAMGFLQRLIQAILSLFGK